MRRFHLVLAVALMLGLVPAGAAFRAAFAATSAELSEVVEAYYDDYLVLNPFNATFNGDHRYDDQWRIAMSAEERAVDLALEQKYLQKIEGIDPFELDDLDRTTWEIFRRNRLEAIADHEYPAHLLPVDQFFSVPNLLAMVGSGSSIQPFQTLEDHENWLQRARGYSGWVDQAILNMREGMKRGIVQPRIIMEKVLPQLASQITDNPEASMFYLPVKNASEDLPADELPRLAAAYKELISESIVPAYERLHAFIETEYMPHTRETFGYGGLPGGDSWYAHLVKTNTTTDLTPEEIHEIGLREVERLQAEILRVRELIAADPQLQGEPLFTSEEDMLETYRDLRTVVQKRAARLFESFPKADFEVRPVEEFRQASAAGASYQPASPDGSRPGVFYVNTRNANGRAKMGAESLYLHEAVPGHHFQITIQRELENLPRFRRFGGFTAYIEGWGLYAETIGKEMGMYEDPYMYIGALGSEIFRAKRLVVDTGIHAKGWSHAQAVDYMGGNVSEVERYMVIPGQALAYKVGQLEISRLRARAEEQLGDAFDVRRFHTEVLKDGALPLAVLSDKIDRWIASQLPASARR